MRKRLSLIALLFISLFSACSDDSGTAAYKCTDCVDEPEANAAYDNTGQGIYKGVLIGSSGTIKFNIANDGSTISAILVIDGTSVTLTASGFYDPAVGFQGTFSGTLHGGSVTIPFSVDSEGVVTMHSPTIPGHSNVIIGLFKETSSQLVEAFEGSYSGDDAGTFNMVVLFNENGSGAWVAISRRSMESIDGYFSGQITEQGELSGEMSAAGDLTIIAGKLNGDNVKGTWTNSTTSGIWIGKRTL